MTVAVTGMLGGGYLISNKPIPQTQQVQSDEIPENTNLVCSVENGGNKGTIYIQGNKIRGSQTDKKSETGEEKTNEFLLIDNRVWIWNTETEEGFIVESTDNFGEEGNLTYEKLIGEIDIETNCKIANFDSNVFDIPPQIKFETYQNLINKELYKIED